MASKKCLSETTVITGSWTDHTGLLTPSDGYNQYYFLTAQLIDGALYGWVGRYNSTTHKLWMELSSVDGLTWTPKKSGWIPFGESGDYYAGMAFGKTIVGNGRELRFYYGGSVGDHAAALPRDARLCHASLPDRPGCEDQILPGCVSDKRCVSMSDPARDHDVPQKSLRLPAVRGWAILCCMRGYFPALSGLRGLAALTVVMFHAASIGLLPDLLAHNAGTVAVGLFFVLSGFLMGHLYLSQSFSASALGAYGRARVGRVYPLYALVIVIACALNSVGVPFHYGMTAEEMYRHLVLIDGKSIFWSVSVEIQFYAIFALVWWAHRGRPENNWILLPPLIATPFLLALPGVGPGRIDVFPVLPYFWLGMVLSVFVDETGASSFWRLIGHCLPIALLFYMLSWPGIAETVGLPSDDVRSPSTLLALGLLVISAATSRGILARGLSSRPMIWLGEISFAVYLLHFPVLDFARAVAASSSIPKAFVLALALLVILTSARLVHLLVERPARTYIRRIGKREAVPA